MTEHARSTPKWISAILLATVLVVMIVALSTSQETRASATQLATTSFAATVSTSQENRASPTQLAATEKLEMYVSLKGNDKRGDGSIENPFATLNWCLRQAAKSDSTDISCLLCAGRHTAAATSSFKSAISLTISGYQGAGTDACDAGTAIVDGTDVLNLEWTLDSSADIPGSSSGCVYRSSSLGQTDAPWQLWMDDTVLTPARWPNARLDDFSAFSGEDTTGMEPGRFTGPLAYYKDATPAVESKTQAWPAGTALSITDDGSHYPSLAESNINFTDAQVVMTLGESAVFMHMAL